MSKASSSIDTNIAMLELKDNTLVVFVSGVNNSKKTISIYLSTTALTSGSDSVGLTMVTTYTPIPAAADSKFGVLGGTEITVYEKTPGLQHSLPQGLTLVP